MEAIVNISEYEEKLANAGMSSEELLKLKDIFGKSSSIKQYTFIFILNAWIKDPSFKIKISLQNYDNSQSGILDSLPPEFLKLVSESDGGFISGINEIAETGKVTLSQFQLNSFIWQSLTLFANRVPFIQIDKEIEVTENTPNEIRKSKDKASSKKQILSLAELQENPEAYAKLLEIIQQTFITYFKLSTDLMSLYKPGKKERNSKGVEYFMADAFGISSGNIGSLVSGRWIPSSFYIKDAPFKYFRDKKTYQIKILDSKYDLTKQELAALICEQMYIVFPELKLVIPES